MDIEKVNDIATLKGFEAVFSNVVSIAIALAGIAFFIMLLVAGFNYLTAGAEAAKAEAAKKTLTTAVTGLVLVALAFLILQLITTFTGIDVTQFKITQ